MGFNSACKGLIFKNTTVKNSNPLSKRNRYIIWYAGQGSSFCHKTRRSENFRFLRTHIKCYKLMQYTLEGTMLSPFGCKYLAPLMRVWGHLYRYFLMKYEGNFAICFQINLSVTRHTISWPIGLFLLERCYT